MSPTRSVPGEDAAPQGAPDGAGLVLRTTSVSSTAHVQARLDLLLAQCRRRRSGLALLRVSVERVSHAGAGVSAGMEQRVRQEVSNRIGNAVRGSDAVLRESDRETCVVLPGADGSVADRVARRLESLVSGDYCVAGKLLQVELRIGAAVHPEDGALAPELLRQAGPPA